VLLARTGRGRGGGRGGSAPAPVGPRCPGRPRRSERARTGRRGTTTGARRARLRSTGCSPAAVVCDIVGTGSSSSPRVRHRRCWRADRAPREQHVGSPTSPAAAPRRERRRRVRLGVHVRDVRRGPRPRQTAHQLASLALHDRSDGSKAEQHRTQAEAARAARLPVDPDGVGRRLDTPARCDRVHFDLSVQEGRSVRRRRCDRAPVPVTDRPVHLVEQSGLLSPEQPGQRHLFGDEEIDESRGRRERTSVVPLDLRTPLGRPRPRRCVIRRSRVRRVRPGTTGFHQTNVLRTESLERGPRTGDTFYPRSGSRGRARARFVPPGQGSCRNLSR